MIKTRLVDSLRRLHFFPLVLLLIVLIAFGLLTPWLGFQGDDWHLLWLNYRIGDLNPFFNLTRFSTQWIYQLVMPLMAPVPWQWFQLANLFRWLGGLSVFLLFARLFPEHKHKAGVFALLYTLYPGYLVSYLPVTLLASYLQPLCLFLSFYVMVLWMEAKTRKNWLLGISLAASLANLLLSEYFFFLELLRPLVIWQVLQKPKDKKVSIRDLFDRWWHFLAIFLFIFASRIFTQIQGAGRAIATFNHFSSLPGPATRQLVEQIFHDLYTVILQPLLASFSPRVDLTSSQGRLIALGSVLVGLIAGGYLLSGRPPHKELRVKILPALGTGLLAFLLAGMPFWIAGLQPVFSFDLKNRYALTQALSFAIFLYLFLNALPSRWRGLQSVIIALLAGLFTNAQLQSAAVFRAEWDQQRWMFWQLAWRAPQLKPGSVILMNDPGFQYSGENSVSAELNWNYQDETHPLQSAYFLYFDEHRFLTDFPEFPVNKNVDIPHMLGAVKVNPSQLIVLRFTPSGCLRVLDPQIDELDGTITDFTHKYIHFADPAVIQAGSPQDSKELDPAIFWDEPAHGWCYLYQKADLARQLGDWPAVVEIANLALAKAPPNPDPADVRPYIEGYAHTGDWQSAIQLTENILASSAGSNRLMCAVWQRIGRTTPASPQKSNALGWMTSRTGCNF